VGADDQAPPELVTTSRVSASSASSSMPDVVEAETTTQLEALVQVTQSDPTRLPLSQVDQLPPPVVAATRAPPPSGAEPTATHTEVVGHDTSRKPPVSVSSVVVHSAPPSVVDTISAPANTPP
jgi:hypothetical protein